MPLRQEVRQLGGRWPNIIARASAFSTSIPSGGVSATTFERAVLFDVNPLSLPGLIEALHSRGIVWRRRNRGAIRIYSRRPDKIGDVLGKLASTDALLSSIAPHAYRSALALGRREEAKQRRDFSAAQEAREELSTALGRTVESCRRHLAKGLAFAEARRAMWALFPADVMETLAAFEPAFERGASAVNLSAPEARQPPRIAPGLSLDEKVIALVAKAGDVGSTKSRLYQGIRPKPEADALGRILERLVEQERVDARAVGRSIRYYCAG